MLLVKTKLGVSSVHGFGLIADEFIPKGTVTWEYHPVFDCAFTDEEVMAAPEIIRKTLLHFCYFDKELNKHVLCGDGQRFINHSQDVSKINIESITRRDVAARDIQPGEEFLCDYRKFDDTYFPRLKIDYADLK